MNKELEALKKIGGALGTLSVDDNGMPKIIIEGERGKNWLILKSAIERLEAIDNANPSEVLECVDVLYANAIDLTTENTKYLPEYLKPIRDKIKQALLKSQKDEKIVLGIEDYLNLRIKTEPREDVRKAFIEIRDQLHVIEEVVK